MSDPSNESTNTPYSTNAASTASTNRSLARASSKEEAQQKLQEAQQKLKEAHRNVKVALYELIDAHAQDIQEAPEEEQEEKWNSFVEENADMLQNDPDYCNRTFPVGSCAWINCMKTATDAAE